jgi:predicted nucleic acid-binding protein
MQPGEEQASRAFAWTRRLDRAAAYDSFYLALAEELNCDLWTVDHRLASAANQPWVRLVAVA